MKLAVTSTSFAAPIAAGDLTQLEWLAACAERLDVDGVAYGLAEFPRRDPEYVAQLRKIATDLGLVPVALDVPGLLDPASDSAVLPAMLALALQLGTALIRATTGPAGPVPPETFAATVGRAKAVAGAAKAANVTVTVAAAPGTSTPDLAAVRHLLKDVDSAWLRYDIAAGDPDRASLGSRDRVLVERLALGAAPAGSGGRGWLVLEGDGGPDPFDRVATAVAALRRSAAARTLAPE